MNHCNRQEAKNQLMNATAITFLTGAGISTPSGIPDYRSLKGIYQGLEAPEYLLSRTCMQTEPEKFYTFVMNLYHPEAKPNVIHQKIAALATNQKIRVVTQNIDGLHEKAGTAHCTNFHGTLYACTCRRCNQVVAWQEYIQSDRHESCGGQIRPDVVLYGEGFQQAVLDEAMQAVAQADLLVIVGTSFQVHPFCDLIHYKKASADVLVINQTEIDLTYSYQLLQEDASHVFKEL